MSTVAELTEHTVERDLGGKTVPTRGSFERTYSESRLAFSCLVHPWSLLALGLLGINDHCLKGTAPSWLTGKLSDFAGLFYFPFLVIIFAGLVTGPRFSRTKLPVGRFVFLAVGAWFTAAKTIPVVHAATVRFAEALVGDVQIIRDPTDALALIALIPAWLLYRHRASTASFPFFKAIQPAVLGVAVLLTAATSKPFTASVNRLVVHDDQLYAVVGDEYENSRRDRNDVFSTQDGVNWQAADLPNVFSTQDGVNWQAADLPKNIMSAHRRRDEIKSGGVTISLRGRNIVASRHIDSWGIPIDRQEFMSVAGAEDAWQALDIATLPKSPGTIVVALGTEGIAVWTDSGSWTRSGVGLAQPTPERTQFRGAVVLVLRGQWVFGAAATLIAWVFMSFFTWRSPPCRSLPFAKSQAKDDTLFMKLRLYARGAARTIACLRGLYVLKLLAALVLPCVFFFVYLHPDPAGGLMILVTPVLALSVLPIVIGWKRFKKSGERVDRRPHFSTALQAGFIAVAMLVLWDVGWVESLNTAFLVALCSVISLVLWRAGRIGSGSV